MTKTFHATFREFIDERKKNRNPDSEETFVDAMLNASETEEFSSLTEQTMCAILGEFMLAGGESITSSLSFLLVNIINRPDIQDKIQEEIDRVIESSRLPKYEDLPKLTYLHAVALEGLRMYPTIPLVPHLNHEVITLGKYTIPAETFVFGSIWAVHRNPVIYPNPNEFRPERWIENPELEHSKHYVPFGVGPRMCVAYSWSAPVLRLVTASILQRLRFSSTDGKPIPIVEDRKFGPTMTPFNAKVEIRM